jgi:hypothetical protein
MALARMKVRLDERPPAAIGALLSLAALLLLIHTLSNGRYGFHRDELATLDDARHLAWGYVAYPPWTPFVARVAVALFGPAPAAIRFFTALAQSAVIVLAGLIARELGGGARAQIVAAMAVAVSPLSMVAGHLFQYVSFDFLWAVLTVYFVLRLLSSGDGRWWIAVGAAIGLGLNTRYTIAWLVAGLAVGFLLTPARRLFLNKWLIAGAAVALVIILPNLIWQASHGFISIDFLQSIHARDVRIGRTDGFLWRQLLVPANVFTVPLWIAGLFFYFRKPAGERYRALGWAFIAALALFAIARGRDYYTAPLYPMLLAAGAVSSDQWPRWARGLNWAGLAVAFGMGVAFLLPIAPVHSRWFETSLRVNGDLREEIGWPELVDTIAKIRDSLPTNERSTVGIFTGNYGEAGAIDLYGPALGLPHALCRANSFWLRGYGDYPPQPLIVIGLSPEFVKQNFTTCEPRDKISNSLGVVNEELHKNVWVCRGLQEPWPEFWRSIKSWQ